MANPQLEDGRIEIANELGDAFAKTHFSSSESKILWVILRKTYGFHKKSDAISYTQFEQGTGLNRWHIRPTIKRLIDREIIIAKSNGLKRIIEYSLQKDYERWKLLPESVIDKRETITDIGNKSITEIGNKLLPKEVIEDKDQSITDLGETITDIGNKSITGLRYTQKQKAITKAIYGEFSNVYLTEEEYQKLIIKFGETGAKDKIENFSEALKSRKGYNKKFIDHYATILNWARMDEKRNGNNKSNLPSAKYEYDN